MLLTKCMFYILVQIFVMNLTHFVSYGLNLTLVTEEYVSFITACDELVEQSQVNEIFSNYQIRIE
jgi:hypothetical protein